jgi:PAS domain S-box-containing protein
LRELLQRLLPGTPPFITLFPAIALVGVLCGPGAGSVAAGVGLLVVYLRWIVPVARTLPQQEAALMQAGLFVLASAIILLSAAILRAALAEASVARSLLDLALASGRAGTWDYEFDTGQIAGSGGAIALHELPADGLAQPFTEWREVVHPDDVQALNAQIEQAVADGTHFACDYRLRSADGTVRWISSRGQVVTVGRGKRLVSAFADVTDLIGAQQALQRHEARFRAVLQQIPAAVAIVGAPTGELLLRSDRSDDILGHAPIDIRNPADITRYGAIHPGGEPYDVTDYPIMRSLLTGAVAEGEALVYRRPDGRCIDMEVYSAPIREADGAVVAAVGVAFDVSERKRAEQALRASEEQLSVALAAAALGVWQIDVATGRTFTDDRAARMLGLGGGQELSPRRLLQSIHPADRKRAAAEFRAAMSSGRAFNIEIRGAGPEPAWFVCQAIRLSDGGRVVGVVRDVTARRQREEQLRAALDARELLIREADHRIKNSLQLVVSLLTVQLRSMSDPGLVEALKSAVTRVNAVAASHLALQKSPDLKNVAFADMLSELCQHLAELSPAIRITCQPRGELVLDADRAIPLALVVSELVTNALRHAFTGAEAGLVSVAAYTEDRDLVVVVRDDGVGIPAAAKAEGLGSIMIRSLTAKLGAQLSAWSAPGRGTAITIRMPCDQAAEMEAPATRLAS